MTQHCFGNTSSLLGVGGQQLEHPLLSNGGMAGIKRLANTPPGLPAPAPMQHGHCDGSLPPFGNSQQQHYHYHHHSDRTTGDKHHHTYNQHHQVQLSPVRAALGDLTNALTGSNSNTMAAPVPNKSKKQQQPRTDDQPPPSIPPGPGYPRLSCTQTPKGSRHPPHPADVGIAAHNYMLMCDAAESARPRTATELLKRMARDKWVSGGTSGESGKLMRKVLANFLNADNAGKAKGLNTGNNTKGCRRGGNGKTKGKQQPSNKPGPVQQQQQPAAAAAARSKPHASLAAIPQPAAPAATSKKSSRPTKKHKAAAAAAAEKEKAGDPADVLSRAVVAAAVAELDKRWVAEAQEAAVAAIDVAVARSAVEKHGGVLLLASVAAAVQACEQRQLRL